jgi:type I restriction enzyme S subunit
MSKLKKYKFSALYEMSSGISTKPEQAGKGYPFISFSTIFNNYFIPLELPDLMDSSDNDRIKYSVKEGDIFLTRTSETVDELGMSSVAIQDMPNATFSGFAKRLRPIQNDITYHKFMAFYLRSKLFRKTMNNNALMTLRASLNEQIFSYLELLLPDYNTQKKIGDLLFLINSRVELNNKINDELEDLAIEYFNYWFIQYDFPNKDGMPYKTSSGQMEYDKTLNIDIPLGWEVKRINNYLTIDSGYSFDSNSYLEKGKYKIITIKNVQDSKFDTKTVSYIDDKPVDLSSTCELCYGDILISLTGNVGRTCLVSEVNTLLNQRVGKFNCDKKYHSYFYLLSKRREQRQRLIKISTGSSQKNLSPIDAVKVYSSFPTSKVLEEFNKVTNPLIDKIVSNEKVSRKLEKLRDWLLPMLINGQITLKEAQEHINQAAEPQEDYS